jgi:DNA-binding transcriptional ArsR family regulator
MEVTTALHCLTSLAQPTRLAVFRLLLSNAPHGIPAGDIARALEVPQNTMSSHLGQLAHAGLVRGERQSRSIVYRADLDRFRGLIAFLLYDCCGGRPEMCSVVLDGLMAPRSQTATSQSNGCCGGG